MPVPPGSGFFPQASQVAIFGGNFIHYNVEVGGNGGSNGTQLASEHLWLVYNEVSPNAILNSGGRLDSVRCHPGTRGEVIARVDRWIAEGYMSDRRIFWLSGPAGAGKSAICQTIAENWIERKVPVANFFFFRSDPSRSDSHSLVATLLYQIFSLYPETKDIVNSIIRSDPVVLRQSIQIKVRRLIQEPLSTVRKKLPSQAPIVILIDGLDECGPGTGDQQSLLCLLDTLVKPSDSPFIAFVASRAEPHLTMTFNELGTSRNSIYLNDSYRPERDIRLFVEEELTRIKNAHGLRHLLDPNWPSKDVITAIVAKSSGQFVYASTVMRYIKNSPASPAISMDTILGLQQRSKLSPFTEIDAMYAHILQQAHNWGIVRNLLAAHKILHLPVPSQLDFMDRGDLHYVTSYLGYNHTDVESGFADLVSIIEVIQYNAIGRGRDALELNLHHSSLQDFLYDETRAKDFYIDLHDTASSIVEACINQPSMNLFILRHIAIFLNQVTKPSGSLNKALQNPKPHYSTSFPYFQVAAVYGQYILASIDDLYERQEPQLHEIIVGKWYAWFEQSGCFIPGRDKNGFRLASSS